VIIRNLTCRRRHNDSIAVPGSDAAPFFDFQGARLIIALDARIRIPIIVAQHVAP